MNVTPLSASHELEAGDDPASGSQLHGMGVALCYSLEGAAVILTTTDTPASSLCRSGKKSFISAPTHVLKALMAAFFARYLRVHSPLQVLSISTESLSKF